MIWAAVALGGAIVGVVVAISFWKEIRRLVLDWLHRNGLQRTALTEAFIILDAVASGARRRIRVTAPSHGPRLISDEVIPLDQLDPALRARLENQTHVEVDVLSQL